MNAQSAVRCPVVAVLGFLLAGASPAAAQPEVVGQWDFAEPELWPKSPYHAIHSPIQKILVFSTFVSNQSDNTAQLWDPFAHTLECKPFPAGEVSHNLGCAGHAGRVDGSVLIAGGRFDDPPANFTHEFTAAGEWLIPEPADMTHPRFYPTCVTLPDGSILALGGTDMTQDPSVDVLTPEIYSNLTNNWSLLPCSADKALGNYPFAFVLPDGNVGVVGAENGSICFPACDLSMTKVLDLSTPMQETWSDVDETSWDGDFGSAVMYAPGKVLKAGGYFVTGIPSAVALTATIDFNSPSPFWTPRDPMDNARRVYDLVLLPDGKILAVGGVGVKEAEWIDPEPGPGNEPTWETLAQQTTGRGGHDMAFLLPDATVVSAGSPGTAKVEIFSPPYLFWGTPPTILSAPSVVGYGKEFSVVLESMQGPPPAPQIDKVTLVRLAAVTHGFDQNQRYVELAKQLASPDTLTVTSPGSPNDAPPGYYMLFVVNNDGVPSRATYIQVTGPQILP